MANISVAMLVTISTIAGVSCCCCYVNCVNALSGEDCGELCEAWANLCCSGKDGEGLCGACANPCCKPFDNTVCDRVICNDVTIKSLCDFVVTCKSIGAVCCDNRYCTLLCCDLPKTIWKNIKLCLKCCSVFYDNTAEEDLKELHCALMRKKMAEEKCTETHSDSSSDEEQGNNKKLKARPHTQVSKSTYSTLDSDEGQDQEDEKAKLIFQRLYRNLVMNFKDRDSLYELIVSYYRDKECPECEGDAKCKEPRACVWRWVSTKKEQKEQPDSLYPSASKRRNTEGIGLLRFVNINKTDARRGSAPLTRITNDEKRHQRACTSTSTDSYKTADEGDTDIPSSVITMQPYSVMKADDQKVIRG